MTKSLRVTGDDERSPVTPCGGDLPQSLAAGLFTVPFADPVVVFGERVLLSVRTPFVSSAFNLAVLSVSV